MKDRILEIKQKYPPLMETNERTDRAISLYKKIIQEAKKQGWDIYVLSGFAIDAHFGYLTRQHKDIDFMAPVETIPAIKRFLESQGHSVYEPDLVKGACVKVDQAEPDKPLRAHADIHYFWEDEQGRVTMPSHGKEMKLTTNAMDATTEMTFLGETTRFLKLEYLLEEKEGWHKQVGLKVWPQNLEDIEKINYLIALVAPF